MCFEFVKSFSCLLAKCLGINIYNINIDEYIKELNRKIKIKPPKSKSFENKGYYEEKIKETKEKIQNYLSLNKNLIN